MVYELHNTTSALERVCVFVRNNEHLLPDPLSFHVDIKTYCLKLLSLGRVFIFEESGLIQGICMGYINDSLTFISHLQVLIVQSSEQHKGIGKELVLFFIAESKRAGMKRIRLTCDLDNHKARSFYESVGFFPSIIMHPNPNKLFLDYALD